MHLQFHFGCKVAFSRGTNKKNEGSLVRQFQIFTVLLILQNIYRTLLLIMKVVNRMLLCFEFSYRLLYDLSIHGSKWQNFWSKISMFFQYENAVVTLHYSIIVARICARHNDGSPSTLRDFQDTISLYAIVMLQLLIL